MSKENSAINFISLKQLLDETIVMFDIIKPTIDIVKLHLFDNHIGDHCDQYCQTVQLLITLNDALWILEEISENLAAQIPKFIETVPAIHPKDKMSCFAPHIKCTEVRKSMIMLHLIKQFYALCNNIKEILSSMTLDMPLTKHISYHNCYRRGLKRDSTNSKARSETAFNLLKKEYKELHNKLQDLQKYSVLKDNNYEKVQINKISFKQFINKCKEVLIRLKSKDTNITTELVLEQLQEAKKRLFSNIQTVSTDRRTNPETKSNWTWTVQNYKLKLDNVSYDLILTDSKKVTASNIKKSMKDLSSCTTVHINLPSAVEIPKENTNQEIKSTKVHKEVSINARPVRYKSKMNSKVQNDKNVTNIKETWNSFNKKGERK